MGQATTGRKWGSERFIKLIIQLLDCNSYVCLYVWSLYVFSSRTGAFSHWGISVALPLSALPLIECKLNFGLQSHLILALCTGLAQHTFTYWVSLH